MKKYGFCIVLVFSLPLYLFPALQQIRHRIEVLQYNECQYYRLGA